MIGFDSVKTLFLIGNFFILMILLKKFFFKPILEILENRKEKIKEGLEQREIARQEKEQFLKEKDEIIAEGRSKGKKIIEQAEETKKDIVAKAKEEAEKIIKEAKLEISKEREKFKEEMDLRLVDLVSSAAYTALPSLAKQKDHKALVENTVLESLKQLM